MNVTKQRDRNDETPVVSPLVNDKTYGERWYGAVFDWGLNYWTNLLSSAGFSQWAEHGTRSVSWLGDKSPRQWQAEVSKTIAEKDPFMNGWIPFTRIENPLPFMKGFRHKIYSERDTRLEELKATVEQPIHQHRFAEVGKKIEFLEKMEAKLNKKAEFEIGERAMARARSLILLVPGFAVVIPTVWLGAKIKPWFVNAINRHHYGAEAMDDPSMIARQQAIEAEARPTFLGTVVARLGTVVAAQTAAQMVGSKNNFINRIGEKHHFDSLTSFGVDPVTEKIGETLGNATPKSLQKRFNALAGNHGFEASEHQIRDNLVKNKIIHKYDLTITPEQRAIAKANLGTYSTATQDLGRFVAADTFYTMVTALTIHPLVKLLRKIPGMSYQPKMPQDSAYFGSDATVTQPKRIRVPANEFGAFADRAEPASAPVMPPTQADAPTLSISQGSAQGTIQHQEQQIA